MPTTTKKGLPGRGRKMSSQPVGLKLSALVALLAAVLVAGGCQLATPVAPSIDTALPFPTATLTRTVSVNPSPTLTSSPTSEAGPQLLTPPAVPESPVIPALPSGAQLEIRHIDMIDETSGWALGGMSAGDDHILWTTDAGRTWQDRTPSQYRPGAASRLLASGHFRGRAAWVVYFDAAQPLPGGGPTLALIVWHTRDAGENWTASDPVGVEFIGGEDSPAYLEFSQEERGWLMARAGGAGMHRYPIYLLRSDDSGQSWHALEDPYDGVYLQSCQKSGIEFGSSQIGIVTIEGCPVEGPQIEITRDGGRTWDTVILPPPEDNQAFFRGSFCLEVHPAAWLTSSTVLIGVECAVPESDGDRPLNLLYRSRDGGLTWENVPYPGGQLAAVGPDQLLALGTQIHRSVDGGLTWTLVKQVAWDGQFDFVDSQHGWAVAREAGEIAFVRTDNGGNTWQLLAPTLAEVGN